MQFNPVCEKLPGGSGEARFCRGVTAPALVGCPDCGVPGDCVMYDDPGCCAMCDGLGDCAMYDAVGTRVWCDGAGVCAWYVASGCAGYVACD